MRVRVLLSSGILALTLVAVVSGHAPSSAIVTTLADGRE
jgi:hypothetical protein